ncbi:MAG: hypothetical protein JO021_19630 [Alphaproteobacteria bacterium]|nr:hypothetical protein [Alphaproteobacteria bacterium]
MIRSLAAIVLVALLGGCEQPPRIVAPTIVLPFENRLDVHTATSAQRGDMTYIPPTDPRYSENGAPRAGQITGGSLAGDPDQVGAGRSYAPVASGKY